MNKALSTKSVMIGPYYQTKLTAIAVLFIYSQSILALLFTQPLSALVGKPFSQTTLFK